MKKSLKQLSSRSLISELERRKRIIYRLFQKYKIVDYYCMYVPLGRDSVMVIKDEVADLKKKLKGCDKINVVKIKKRPRLSMYEIILKVDYT